MEIRKALMHESEEIAKLYNSLVGTKDCLWTETYPSLNHVIADIEADCLYVIKVDEKIIAAAYAGVDHNLLGLECWNKEIKNPKVLARIGVLPEYQNRGVGRKILEYIESDIVKIGYDAIYFIVGNANNKAINFYDSMNYNCCGELYIYDTDWFCYEKKLI